MPLHRALLLLAMNLLASTAIAAPPPFAAPASGVPLSLARERAARAGNLR